MNESTEGPTFSPGEVVAGRYRVTRFLGQGAVGEVYGADDLQLGSAVALKLLRPMSGGLHSIERFKREILLARRVSHPNVCRIFDFGVHTPEAGDDPRREVAFLTMELLDGETLARRIEDGGPLPDDEVTRLAIQLCHALSAAEAAGIVHRDLKSANILLVGERAVVTDFGLARSDRAGSDARQLTEVGGLLGTPAYMAPEQVAGRPATASSDLYALGVVLYEAVTGALPFTGSSPLEIAIRRLDYPPTPIESHGRDLPPRLRQAILRCLERDPADRFGSAGELERYLDPPTRAMPLAERTTADPRRGRAPRAGRPKRIVTVAAAIALVALAGWALWQTRHRAAPAAAPAEAARPAPLPARRSIAVLGLGNSVARAEAQWISAALSEMLASEVAAGGEVRAVPGETVARVRQDLGISTSETLGEATLGRLRTLLGADYVLLGSYVALGGEGAPLRVDLRLQSTAAGEAERAFSFEGSESGIFDIARRAGAELRRGLGLAALPGATTAGAAEATAAVPATPAAVKPYAEGLEALRSYDPARARALFDQAVAADPQSPLPRAALAEALSELGYDEEAAVAASAAFGLATKLPRPEQLAVEALHRRLAREWPKAIEISRALHNFYPDDVDLGLKLAAVELEAGEARAALETVDELRGIDSPSAADARIDLVEARAAELLSDYRRQLAAAERAVASATANGARSILARARYEKGSALRRLGDTAGAAAELEGARALAAALGNRADAASATQALANLERARGDLGRAERLFEEARSTFAALGNRRREARAELSLGLVASERGDLAAAKKRYEGALATLTAIGDRRGAAAAAANLGTMLYLGWDLAGSEKRQQEALATFRALEDRSRELVSLANLAQIRRDRGDLPGAEALWKEALAIARATGDGSDEATARLGLGETHEVQGDAAGARQELSKSRELSLAAGELPRAAAAAVGLARLEREAGRVEAAAAEFDRLAAEFGGRGEADDRLEAEIEAARSLLLLPARRDEGRRRAGEVAALAARSSSAQLRHLGRLLAAEGQVAAGEIAAARRTLNAGLEAARTAGHVVATFEVRLALAAADAAEKPDGGAALRGLAVEARAAGLGKIAHRAEALAEAAGRAH